VDPETGEVRVLEVVAVHDSGVPVNPIDFEGQITGGVVMGIGAALGEEVIYEGGRVVNPSYMNYAMPRAADLPRIRPISVGQVDPVGPYGAKSIGEIALNPTAASVANAIAHAVGIRIRDLPITPDKVLAALREKQGRRARDYRLWRRPDRWWVALLRALYPRGVHFLLHKYGTKFARPRRPRSISMIERPRDLEGALGALDKGNEARPLGGGTDLLPARDQGLTYPTVLVDLTSVRALSRIWEEADGALVIGAGARLADIQRSPALAGDPAIREAVESIASTQIREMATVGGNLCQEKRCWFYRNGFECYKRGGVTCPCYAVMGDHRFHHAVMGAHRCQAVTPSDLATVLAALDASVVLAGPKGMHRVPIERFYSGPGETILSPGEIVTEVRVGGAARKRTNRFEKMRLWQGDFAIVSAATSVSVENGVVREARVVLGAVAPTPYRAIASEAVLVGSLLDAGTIHRASEAWTHEAHPLEKNGWKVDAAAALVRRCLRETAGGPVSSNRQEERCPNSR
jgi:CO/xanthine dehydrogenase FAD-binding subunit